jgi:CBS domain containing-hemolysin-like protein
VRRYNTSLVIGELVPKRLALAFPERAASLIAIPLAFVARIALPVVWLLRLSTNTALRLLGVGDGPEARGSPRRRSGRCWRRAHRPAWSSRSSTS